MKHIILAVIILFSVGNAIAQFLPNNAQGFQLMPQYNPAFTGVESFGDMKLSYRYQWTGFGADAPKFINLTYNTRLRQPLDMTLNALRTSNAAQLAPEKMPRAKGIVHGLGFQVFNEQVGQVKRMGGGVNYAFNYPLSPKLRIAAGVAVIVDNIKIDLNKIELRDPDAYYDHLVSNGATQTDLSARAGFVLYSNRFYIGGAYLPLWNSALQSADVTSNEAFYIATGQMGVALPLSPAVTIKPSVMALLGKGNDLSFDYSVKTFVQDKVWFGFTYRDTQFAVIMAGFNISDAFSVSYSYELSTSGMKQFGDGSHELVAALRINNFKRQNQYTW